MAAEPQGEAVRITMDDEGPGLPPGREEAVFEKFERGSKEAAAPGVGLAICRAIVQAHGGRMHGENRIVDGRVAGARFVITLPRGEPPQDDGSQAAVLPDNAMP
ncbi:MAG: ATP-binding protein [Alicycliphilus sp.]